MSYSPAIMIKNLSTWCNGCFADDQERYFLWWPVGIGCGIAAYFSLKVEPSFLESLLPGLLCVIALVKSRYGVRIFFLAALSVALGFTAAKTRTSMVATVMLEKKLEKVHLSGRIVDIEEQEGKTRLILDNLIYSEAGKRLPEKVRLSMTKAPSLSPGDQVEVITTLLPLSDPVSLTGYNFRRQAYFQGIGAIGRITSLTVQPQNKSLWSWLNATRYSLTKELRTRLPGTSGEIAAALITGDRSGIPQDVRQAFTDAGLAHILAISGLHLSLVAGLIFMAVRRGLALIPAVAERYAIKKWAAVIAFFATAGYLAISGFGIPAQRSFIMTAIVMLAILLDRNPFSMRLVATAAVVILLLRPESLLSASFQLSFAAVVALIAAYEGGWQPLRRWSLAGGYWRKGVAYLLGVIATTIVATLATTPYVVYIFNRFTLQAIVGNLLAIPLVGMVIMPACVLAVFSLVIGGINWIFVVLSLGVHLLIGIAQSVSTWPGAAILLPTPPLSFLILTTLGGVWVCLWRQSWRWLGLTPIALGIVLSLFHRSPDIYVAGDGSLLALRDGRTLKISSWFSHAGGFFSDLWLRELGLKERAKISEDFISFKRGQDTIVFLRSRQKVDEACRQATILISPFYVWRICQAQATRPKVIIDRYNLNRYGTHLIWLKEQGVEVQTVRQSLGKRPWVLVNRPERYKKIHH